MPVTPAEADFIYYYRRLLSGSQPGAPSAEMVGLGAEAAAAFQRGLAGVAIR